MLNKAIIQGNIGTKPEIRFTKQGRAVCNFNVATSDSFKDKNGEKQEHTEWHRIVVWGKTAEHCAKYLDKGSNVLVEGRLQTRKWDDNDGNKRYTTEIIASNVQFLNKPSDKNQSEEMPQASVSNDDIPF